ncbi:uncharacterized protein MELLADRAFT_118352 [Melampsora larici-populina 98AG31]|uniref:Uncharacterized protein n=1 Tax=Melampsora larici-populina (strain 98AG31 / pathotype 3-4-7) TaxID=747676 RepID=F4S836_MELLP|nr:uncharacterized protein MELLADRAFT_118352 [Melampsora larici-populina 98AG31]EGF99222.1 hypothetical protein MELLADRAFT_118352 [Melampsora larici-populina 98AG31]
MASQSPERSLTTIQQSTMRRADSTRSNTSSRSVRNGDSKQQEDLINALEAEEERLVNTLTRKLEKLRAEKVELESVLEAESESLVLRLQRRLSLLMQQQQQSSQSTSTTAAIAAPATSPPGGPNINALVNNPDPLHPSANTLIELLKTENSNLRNRLVDTEREYIKTSRQSDMYRNELIALRQRVGLPIDDLIGAIPTFEENYPAARRRSRGASASGNGIPIPGMTSSDGRRRTHHTASISSSSIQLPSSFFTPSTPMTPSSMTDSANAISISLGTTNFTTPSTSYPGLPVPHSTPAATPAASPANGRQQNVSAASDNHFTGNSNHPTVSPPTTVASMYTASRLGPGLSLATGENEASTTSPYPQSVNQSPVSPVSLCDSKSGQVGQANSETRGMSSQGNRTMTASTSQSPRPGGPGRPESRQQSPA